MTPKRLSFRFRAGRPGLKKVFGDLEESIMGVMWADDACREREFTVREVHGTLESRRKIAYTTVMTTMKILADKGILERTKVKRAYVYRPSFTRDEFQELVVDQVVHSLMDDFAEPLLAHFIDLVRTEDVKVASSVERLLQRKVNGEEKEE